MRYSVLDDDNLRQELLGHALEEQGFTVVSRGKLAGFAEALVAADAVVLVGDAEQLAPLFWEIGTAGARAGTKPLILMTPQGSLGDLVPLIHGPVYGLVNFSQGTEALCRKLRAIEAEISTSGLRTGGADAARRGLALLRGAKASGLLHVSAGATVGQILLRRGAIVDAEVGAMRGEDAAAALVAGLSGEVRLDWTSLEESDAEEGEDEEIYLLDEVEEGAPEDTPFDALELQNLDGASLVEAATDVLDALGPVHVLFVDDDEAIRKMLTTTLKHKGYRVTTAVDGREGFDVALAERPHLVISDIMMPKLDGWGFLSLLRNDYRLRETPFALLSCHNEHLEYLSRLGAGADGYLPKGVRLDEIVQQVRNLAEPRLQLLAHLGPEKSLQGRFDRIGPVTLLRALAARNATGSLTVEDAWATYRLALSSGMVASASAAFGSTDLNDDEALRSLVGVQQGTWRFECGVEPDRWTMQRPALEVIEEIAIRATEEEAAIRDQMIAGTTGLIPDTSRLEFYERVCPTALQPIVAKVREGASPREIIAQTDANPLLIDWLFKDMLAKGIVHFREVI